MLKKKMTALLLVLVMAVTLTNPAFDAYAAEQTVTTTTTATNLVLPEKMQVFQSMEMAAGETRKMSLEFTLKDGYCIEPTFSITPLGDAPLSFKNVTIRNKDKTYSGDIIWLDEKNAVTLEYEISVDDFAGIGAYQYAISYTASKDWMDDDDLAEMPAAGNFIMTVTVVNEKMAPQISVVSGMETYCNAGEEVTLSFTLENEGELEAMGVYVFADYYEYDKILTPVYTPLTQKAGNMSMGRQCTMEIKYKVDEKAETQRIKIPLSITYKTANGENGTSANAYLYLYVQGKEATPTPTPTATPTPVPEKVLLLLNNVKQSPSKPKAGENLKVSFNLENAGTADVSNVKISATGLSSSGFEPINSEPYQYVGEIKAGKSKKVELTLKVGENIPEGLNVLNVQYSYDIELSSGEQMSQTENVTLYILDVQNPEEGETTISRPKLMVSNFYTDVEEVKAGSVFDFTFELLNTNDSINAKNIKVTVSGASSAFSVTAGGNSFFVNEIKAQESAPITINLKASAAVTTGAYPINIKIEYEYEGMVATATYSGEVVEEEILLQVKENLRPSVENVYLGWGDNPILNQSITMNFEFYNMGKSTLNNTYVTVEGDFMLANGSNSYYIGNISAGMPEYVEFDVIPLVEGDATGRMIIHMEDSNGDEVTMEKEFTSYVIGESYWGDSDYSDWDYSDPGYTDPSMPVDGDAANEPILPLWMFLCIQGAILIVVIPVTRAIRLAAYRRKIKKEDAI